jgi:hypothetical protein
VPNHGVYLVEGSGSVFVNEANTDALVPVIDSIAKALVQKQP